jgi:hypothetical protein
METAASARANDDAKSSPVEDHLRFRCKYLPDGISNVIDKDGVRCFVKVTDLGATSADRSPLKGLAAFLSRPSNAT